MCSVEPGFLWFVGTEVVVGTFTVAAVAAMSIGGETSKPDQQPSAADQLEAGALLARLIKSSPEQGFSAKHLLTANPLLQAFPGCVVDLAYEQYCRDTDAGKNVTPTEFVKDFSNVQQSLYRILEFDQLLHEHPSLVEGVPAERWPKPGESFCEFQLEEQIGRGALSRVFVAREAKLGIVRLWLRSAFAGHVKQTCLENWNATASPGSIPFTQTRQPDLASSACRMSPALRCIT
ncbi:MAG TPA: hypothetical protein EYG03_07390 [Planctomycetes bacterium]|nr:hypothetical protein [Planctomycetota bacterium]